MTSGTTRSYPIPSSTTPPATTLDTQNGLVSTAIMNVYTARAAITAAKFEGKDPTPDQLATLATDQKALADAEQKLKDLTVEWNEYNIATLSGRSGKLMTSQRLTDISRYCRGFCFQLDLKYRSHNRSADYCIDDTARPKSKIRPRHLASHCWCDSAINRRPQPADWRGTCASRCRVRQFHFWH